jgi:hypothetical protein
MPGGSQMIFAAERIAGKRRVHQNDRGFDSEPADLNAILLAGRSLRKEQPEDFGTPLIDFIEVEPPHLIDPCGKHARSGAGL